MRSLAQILAVGAGGIAAAALLVPGAALAAHGKVGLWEFTTKMDMPGMPQMPDISTMPPAVQARMKAMHMGTAAGGGMKVQHCMTAAEVNQDKPYMGHKECTMTNTKTSAHSFSADMTCSGHFKGTGHMQVTYNSDEHYKGEMTMAGTTQEGQPMNMHSVFEGKWVSASCGSVTN